MMSDVIAARERPPRMCQDVWWERQPRVGFLIDWLDSRPEHAARDDAALEKKARRRDVTACAAGVITGRLEPHYLELDGRVDHLTDYNAHYHAQIAGHLQDDELPLADATYRRLHELAPACMSALVNLAELERRAGHERDAAERLRGALALANGPRAVRYGVSNAAWRHEIHCALARLAHESGAGAELLDASSRERLPDLVALIRRFVPQQEVAIAAHQAFSVASAEQRIVLHAAMQLASIAPTPPPAAHARFDAIGAVEELYRQYSPTSPPATPAGRPGFLGSLVLKILERVRRS